MSSISISSNFSLFHSSDIQASESSLINSSNGLSEPVWVHSHAQNLILSTISGQGVSVLDAAQIENVIHTWSCNSDVKYSFPSELTIDFNKTSENAEGSKGQVEITHDNLFDNEAMKVLKQGYTVYSVIESSSDLGSEDSSKVVWIQNHKNEKDVKSFDKKILKLKPIVINSNPFVLIFFEDFSIELYERDLSSKIDELSFDSPSLFSQLFSINESFAQNWKLYKNSNFGLFTVLKSSDSAQLIANIHSILLGADNQPKFAKSSKSIKLPTGISEIKKLVLDSKTGNISLLDSNNLFTFLKFNSGASHYHSAWASSSLIPADYSDNLHVEYISSDYLALITRDTDTKSNEPILNLQVIDLKYGSIQFNSILTQSGSDAQASNSDVESTKSNIASSSDVLKFSFFSQFIKNTSSLAYQTIQIDRKNNTSELHRNIQVSCVLISNPQHSTLIDLVVNAQEEVHRAENSKSQSSKHAPLIPCNRFFSTQYKLLSEWSDLEAELIPEILKESDSWGVFNKHISRMSKFLSSSMKQLGQNFPKQSKLLKRTSDDKLELFTDDRKAPLTQLDRVSHNGSGKKIEDLIKYSRDSISLLSQNFCATQSYAQLRKFKWDKIEDISPFVTSHISPKYVESWIHYMVKMCDQDSTCPNMAVYNSELMSYFIRFSMVTSSTFRTSHQGILPMLLQRQDWASIQTALVYTPDLSEYELVQLLMVAFENYLKFKKSRKVNERSASLDHFIANMNLVINYDYDPIYLTDALKALNIEQQEGYFTQLVKLLDEHTNLLSHSAKSKFSKIQQFLTCFIDAHSLSLITQPNLQSLNKQLLQITIKAQRMLYRYQMFKSEMLGVVKSYKSEMIGAIHGKRTNEWLDDEEFDEKKEDFLQSRYRRKKNYQIEALYL